MGIEKKNNIKIKVDFCKACGYCVSFCPDNALEFSSDFNSKGYRPVKWKGNCRFCGICYIVCPDYVIEIEEYEPH